MTIIKSVSVGHGDMFYIKHGSDNFTIIDSMLPEDVADRKRIVDEIVSEAKGKGITRFISTHPDQDHVRGLKYLDQRMNLLNFYCVKNATVKDSPTEDFEHYCSLRDDPGKRFHIFRGCSRRWMNTGNDERGSAGINILWPNTSNESYRAALADAEQGLSPNNTSIIMNYSLKDGVTAMWMGDLETDFMEEISDDVTLPRVDLLFAPHHGRESGRVPDEWLEKMNPSVIVLGEAPAQHMYYYPGWNTITQNSAGDLTFNCLKGRVDLHVSSPTYSVNFLYHANNPATGLGRYLGSFDV